MAIQLKRQFVLKKLHQLTGVLPIGAFLLEHFYTNSYAALGPEAFNQAVATLQGLPYLLGIETVFIFLPLLFHGGYGLWITWQGQPNQFQYPYVRNWMYTLQRVTGLILVVYIPVHVLSQRFGVQILNFNPMGKAVAHHPDDAYAIVHATMSSGAALAFYIVGIGSAVFHLAWGLWLFAIDWGVAIGRRGQRYVGYACAVFGVALFLIGLNALMSFTRFGGFIR
jgi:succinate dehydrogenase / fumarate reductase, cytochrome b subunit